MTINRITLGRQSAPDDGENDLHVGADVLRDHKMAKCPEQATAPAPARPLPQARDSDTPDTPIDERGAMATPDPRNPGI